MGKKKTGSAKRSKKSKATRRIQDGEVWKEDGWVVVQGELVRGQGRPSNPAPIFSVVAEKLPYGSLDAVAKDVKKAKLGSYGVYLAHDSMGIARYSGRGQVFARLRSHKKAHQLELAYYSFYMIPSKVHEREIETVCIRVGGPQLHFNDRKKRLDIRAGSVRDWEAGTIFYQRQYQRGKKVKKK